MPPFDLRVYFKLGTLVIRDTDIQNYPGYLNCYAALDHTEKTSQRNSPKYSYNKSHSSCSLYKEIG